MSDFPYPPPQRNRRSGRTSAASPARKPRSGRARKKAPARRKKAGAKARIGLTWWQALILLAMAVGIVLLSSSYRQAQDRLLALEEERRQAEEKYQREVRAHQVKYRKEIEYYAAVYNVDPAYVAAIIKRESDYDPRAVSSKNARGLMQFMPDTFDFVAPNCGLRGASMDAIYEPENAIKMGCWLLNYISRQFDGDPILVACAYHAGWGNARAWVQKYSTDGKTLSISQIPMDDTRYYARKVMEAYAIYQQHYY